MFFSSRIPLRVSVCVGIVLLFWGGMGIRQWFFVPLPIQAPGYVWVFLPGDALSHTVMRLHQEGVLPYPRFFLYVARLHACLHGMCLTPPWQAGEYQLLPGDTLQTVLHKLYHGIVRLHPVTLLPGSTYLQVRTALSQMPYLTHTPSLLSAPARLRANLKTHFPYIEGIFLPETYLVARGQSDVSVLQRAHRAMVAHLQALWAKRAPNLPYHKPFEALILASIIEKETRCEQEKSQIAGVFIRRLTRGMPLASDPTVRYARMQKKDQQKASIKNRALTYHDLKMASPFNTYKVKGLPPSPIALPSLSSLYAALHPDSQHAYLYFVASPDSHCHVFSETFASHKKKVQHYHRAQQRKQGSTSEGKSVQ